MKIVLITQNEPFYLAKNLDFLIKNVPNNTKIVGCVLTEASPFGKKETFFQKSFKTFKVFGYHFFFYYAIKFLISKLDKRKNVKYVLKKHKIPIITLSSGINEYDSVNKIKYYKPDLLISILGNQIFRKQIFKLATHGCLNLHTAILPKYRGLMPTFWVLKNNEKYTGVSVFYVDDGIDSGPIIVQEKIEIGDKNQEQLIRITKKIGMKCIVRAIKLIRDNKVKLIKNDDSKKTYYSFPTKADVSQFYKLNKKFF